MSTNNTTEHNNVVDQSQLTVPEIHVESDKSNSQPLETSNEILHFHHSSEEKDEKEEIEKIEKNEKNVDLKQEIKHTTTTTTTSRSTTPTNEKHDPDNKDKLIIEKEKQEKEKHEKEKEKLPELEANPPDGKVLKFEATCCEQLPKNLKNQIKDAKIPFDVADKHFQILLNILHFCNKEDVYVSKNKLSGGALKSSDKPEPKKEDKHPTPHEDKKPNNTDNTKKPKEVKDDTPKSVKTALEVILSKDDPSKIYKNHKKAGKGGFASVFQAKNKNDKKKVAIKVPHKTVKEKQSNIQEAKYLKRSAHPNVVTLMACYEYKEEFWMVMEYLEGGTLTDARDLHQFNEREIAFVARELLQALAHVHTFNLIHRDVKSSNIMMSVLGEVKLIDFGLCAHPETSTYGTVGSPHWVPPEMIKRKWYGHSADTWSFGISMMELANKNSPANVPKIRAMFNAATVGFPEPLDTPNKWSSHFKDFLKQCLIIDPKLRPKPADLLKHEFLKQAPNDRKDMERVLTEVFLQKAIALF